MQQPTPQHPLHITTPALAALKNAVIAASEFKYLLDMAPPGTLRHLPFKGRPDARETQTYARAAELLAAGQSFLNDLDDSVHRTQVVLACLPVGDVEAKDGADAPAQALDLLAKVRRGLLDVAIEVGNQPARGPVKSGFVCLAQIADTGSGYSLKLVEGKTPIVHGDSSAGAMSAADDVISPNGGPPCITRDAALAMQQPLNITTPALPPRLIAIGADGEPCEPGAHVAVLLPDFGLLVSVELLEANNWQHAQQLAADCRLLGHTDWTAGTRFEQALLIADDRCSPAGDTTYFPKTPSSGWLWTSTPWAPSPSGFAWGVYFYSGYVDLSGRLGGGFVRPLRRVSSGQCLGLLA